MTYVGDTQYLPVLYIIRYLHDSDRSHACSFGVGIRYVCGYCVGVVCYRGCNDDIDFDYTLSVCPLADSRTDSVQI